MLGDWESLAHFHFLRPWFAFFLLPWVGLVFLSKKQRNSRETFQGIIAPHLLEHLRLRPKVRKWLNPRGAASVFALIVLIVLMGPSWRQQASPLHEDEAALVILLDMSKSMEQTDIQPNRLRRSKQKVSDLLTIRPGKKAALVVYAGSAHTVLSLTADAEILNQYLSATTPAIMPRTGKFPEYALKNVESILKETTAPASIVLFTDGLGENSANEFRRFFKKHQHQLLVIGVGSKDNENATIPLEKASLQALARNVGGYYTDLSIDDSDIKRINRRIESHYVVLADSALPWKDSGYALLFPAIFLFLLWFREGWTVSWSVNSMSLALPFIIAAQLLTLPNPVQANKDVVLRQQHSWFSDNRAMDWFASLWLTPDQHGRLLLQMRRYQEAGERFDNPLWKGTAYYYAEEFMRAAEYFSRSDTPDALFNEANARSHARDYVRALARYDRLLKIEPDYPGARENRQKVQALVDEINLLSESQRQEAGVSSEEKQRDSDDAIPAQGADEIAWETAQQQQLTAQELLANPELTQLWLRGISHDPANFLAVKFSMQLNNRETSSNP